MGTVLQAPKVMWVIASLSAIKGLGRDTKVAAGESSIAVIEMVVVKPLESLPGLFG